MYSNVDLKRMSYLYAAGGIAAVQKEFTAASKTICRKAIKTYPEIYNLELERWKSKEPFIMSPAVMSHFLQNFVPKHFEVFSMFKFKSMVETCIEWTAGTEKGYGRFRVRDKRFYSHVLAWNLFRKAKIKSDHTNILLHTCDNPLCGNPFHLQLGTHQENMADMHNKGRNKTFGRESIKQKVDQFTELWDGLMK